MPFPTFLQLRGNETVVRITGSVATLGKTGLVTGLLNFQIEDMLLVFLTVPVHPLRLERGFDRHGFNCPQRLSPNRGVYPWAAEGHASG